MKNLNDNWKISIRENEFKKKVHLRYYNELGQSTNKGIVLNLNQFKWLTQEMIGIRFSLHTIYFPEHALIFKETKNGFLFGISVPNNVIHALQAYSDIVIKMMS